MALELTNWQQVQDFLEKTPDLSLLITERNIHGKETKAKKLFIQTVKNKTTKTIYKKSLKSGEELKDIEVNPYVISLIKSYAGDAG